jgi:hypothetical protein
LGQRIAQEREYWRCIVADLIVEERERLVEALSQKLFDGEALASITRIVKEGLDQAFDWAFDRIDAKLGELDRQFAASMRRPEDDDTPSSKH